MIKIKASFTNLVQQKTFLTYVAVIAILLVSGYLRLHNIRGYMTFLGDEGRDALVVKRMIIDREFTLLGPTASVGGFFLGPIYYYFMLPFLWLWKLDPTGPAVMVALFGIATVYLVYKVGTELFNSTVGLMASSLYALSPLVIAYSRSSWNPNLVQFFSLCLVYFLWRSVEKTSVWDIFFAGVMVGIGLQLHYLFLFLIVLVFFWYVSYGRKKDFFIGYVLGLAGFILGFSPYLAFELRHGFPNTKTIFRFILFGEETGFNISRFFTTIYDVAFRLFGRLVFRIPEPVHLKKSTQLIQYIWNGSVIVTLLLVVLFTCMVFYKRFKKVLSAYFPETSGKTFVLFILWLIIPLFLFGLYQKGIYDYYFGLFFALPFFIVAIMLYVFSKTKYISFLSYGLFIALIILNWKGMPFQYPPNKQLEQAMKISSEAYTLADGKPFNFALITDGNSDHVFRYFFDVWGNPPIVIENEIVDPDRTTVTDQLIVICEQKDCKPLGHPLWEIAGFGQAEIQQTLDVSFVTIMKLVHYEG